MRVFRNFVNLPREYRHAVVALGNFDGLHLGHRAVVARAREAAAQQGVKCAVMTFEPHPRRVFAPHLPPLKLYTLAEKLHLLKVLGVDSVFLQRFTRGFAATSATDFIQNILCRQLAVSHVVTGENFTFGHERGGNATLLHEQSQSAGFAYSALPPVMELGVVCSSSAIRTALSRADMAMARGLLGRGYTISGRVQQGDKRGGLLGFPTANLAPHRLFLPSYGVYAARVTLANGRKQNAVANLGVRPTVDGKKLLLESYLFDFSADIYGQPITVELVEFIRPEQRFESVETLAAQILLDSEKSKAILSHSLV